MAKWVQYYKIVQPTPAETTITDSQFLGDGTTYGAYSWYQRIIQGSANRISRYREYNLMDQDIDVSRALDIIAEEMTGNITKGKDPILIQAEGNNEDLDATLMETLSGALRRWIKVHNLGKKIFRISRGMVKYGDMFFIKKDNFSNWEYIPIENVIAAVVAEDDFTNVVAWQIRRNIKSAEPHNGQTYFFRSTSEYAEHVPADKVVRFTLNDEMSDSAPFGESILKPVYKTFKQRELLEDAILIYRVQRAPERRVFYVDVGKMPPNRVKQYLENFKNEIKQKKVPSQSKNGTEMDSVYNPASINEDFFIACLTLKTTIKLLDGRTITLQEAINEHNQGKENWTYSIDQKTHKMVPGKIEWAGITRKNADIVRVHLDNGEFVDVTPDHKFVLRDGSECQAIDLKENVSLMPLYTKFVKTNTTQKMALYQLIQDNSSGKWKFTHLEVNPKKLKENVIHHIDFNPKNNSPYNLVEMSKEEHYSVHSKDGHTLGRLWKERREDMVGYIKSRFINMSDDDRVKLKERCKINGSKTWNNIDNRSKILAGLKKGTETNRNKFSSDKEYNKYMSDMAKIQWTEEKKKEQGKKTIIFNKKTKKYDISEKMLNIFISLYTKGYNTKEKLKNSLLGSEEFMNEFILVNKNKERVKKNAISFSDKFFTSIVREMGYNSFDRFKKEFIPNHSVVSVEHLSEKEDTGCIYVVEDGENHNFALGCGVYVKNSRPDGRSSKVDVLPGGQSLGEISDLEHFLEKIWRGLRIPSSYMNGGADSAVFNDGKTGIAYIQELRFSLFIERLQVSLEEVLDAEFKKFLRAFGINIDEHLYSLRLPEPSNFGRYREQEMDSVLMNSYSAVDNITHISKRFALKKYLQLSKEQILENEKLKAEELGIEYSEDNPEAAWPQIYGMAAEGAAGGMGGMGGEGDMLAGGMPGEGGEEMGGEEGSTTTQPQQQPTQGR